jgi:hypothetical protein
MGSPQFENSENAKGDNSEATVLREAVDRLQITDNDVKIDQTIHGSNTDMLNNHLEAVAKADPTQLMRLQEGDNPYNQYKNELKKAIFVNPDKPQELRADYSRDAVQKYSDVVTAEANAYKRRILTASKQLDSYSTMAAYA